MERRSTLAVVTLFALGLAACGGKQESAAPAKPAGTTTTTTAVSEFGVPECDEYMNKYLACIDSKVPEQARAMVRQQLETTKAQWKQAASTPEGKQGLAMGCKAATDAAKQAMSAYGCTW
jgi:hypothetical protein